MGGWFIQGWRGSSLPLHALLGRGAWGSMCPQDLCEGKGWMWAAHCGLEALCPAAFPQGAPHWLYHCGKEPLTCPAAALVAAQSFGTVCCQTNRGCLAMAVQIACGSQGEASRAGSPEPGVGSPHLPRLPHGLCSALRRLCRRVGGKGGIIDRSPGKNKRQCLWAALPALPILFSVSYDVAKFVQLKQLSWLEDK